MSSLAEFVTAANAHEGSWKNAQLARDINMFLWERYDPSGDLIYPTIKHWDLMLLEAMADNDYDKLTKDEILSILFGLHHRNRINEGLWYAMFGRGVTQRLLERLLVLDADVG